MAHNGVKRSVWKRYVLLVESQADSLTEMYRKAAVEDMTEGKGAVPGLVKDVVDPSIG